MLDFTELLPLLDHIEYRSGQELAAHFNVTRATIHNCMARIDALGIELERIPGRGYRLCAPLDLLSKKEIVTNLAQEVTDHMHAFKCLHVVDSTNNVASNLELPPSGYFSVVLAEKQSAGKGRRGREWVSPYAANIYASVVWSMQRPMHELRGLSPFLAICVVEALHAMGLPALNLKWPNDIYCNHKKLAGLLIECSGELSGSCKVIVGFGVNVTMKNYRNIEIDQQWTDIKSNLLSWNLSRSQLAAQLVSTVVTGLCTFENKSVSDMVQRWAQWDLTSNSKVNIVSDSGVRQGIARGIDVEGSLLLETKQGIEHISVGEVSMREIG